MHTYFLLPNLWICYPCICNLGFPGISFERLLWFWNRILMFLCLCISTRPSDTSSGNIQKHIVKHVYLWSFFMAVAAGKYIQPNLQYKFHLEQQNCWSHSFSWSITCRGCSNYIFILDLTPGSNREHTDNCMTRRETFEFWDLVHLILEIWWHAGFILSDNSSCS